MADVLDTETAMRARRARIAVFVVFTLAGIGFAAVASRIPDIRDAYEVSPQSLGIILLSLSVGSVIGLPIAGRIAARIGQANAVLLGLAMSSTGLATIAVAVQVIAPQPALMLGFFLTGSGVGIWDVAMNIEGAAVERALEVSVMPHFHAAFSAGTVASALFGAMLSWLGVPVSVHLLVVVAMLGLMGLWATRSFLPRRVAEALDPGAEDGAGDQRIPAPERQRSAWTEPRTLLIGVLVLAAAFTEGTANDWLAVALVDGYGLSNAAGVFGLAVFLSFMTAGRIIGTRWLDAYGRVPVLRVLFVVAAVGAGLVVFGNAVLAFVGAALWGLGASLGFPVGMSAAADEEDRAPMRISVVATIGYMAFIAGPPLLGFLGEHVGVLRALSVVGALALLALLVVPAVREPEPEPERLDA
ncbi:MFS transporter [Nostocoides sp. F2B08]|uniref:MFS transporter n=1 Tax=Nostocoides sp. F2B08 TaxID=2653936 RepID=UPI001D03FC63|nr:MFS transporter [Tetrasphaera sp. F2B08]